MLNYTHIALTILYTHIAFSHKCYEVVFNKEDASDLKYCLLHFSVSSFLHGPQGGMNGFVKYLLHPSKWSMSVMANLWHVYHSWHTELSLWAHEPYVSIEKYLPILRSWILALPSAGAVVQWRGAMATITSLAQWGIAGLVSISFLILPIGKGGGSI